MTDDLPDDFEELMRIVREPPQEPKPRTPEAQWRQDYRTAMAARRAIIQPDLFGGPASVHYRRHTRHVAPLRPAESVAEKLKRIEGDRNATFGPGRADRPTYPTDEEKAAVIAGAANWLRVGQRVRVVDAPSAVDPAFGPERRIGREGVVWRLCSPVFADRVYVYLDPVGGERAEKIEFLELRDLEPID